MGHDAFRGRGGLGKGCALVFALVLAHQQTVRELTGSLGVRETTIRRRIARLCAVGMVTETSRGVWAGIGSANLDGVAATLGTSGKGLRQKQRYASERIQYRAALSRRST